MEHDLFSLPEHLSSPQFLHVLVGFALFILSNYMSMSSRFRSVMYYDTFFLPPICFSFCFLKFMFFLMLFVFTDVQHDFHVRWCSCHLIVTRRVAQMGKELITLPKTWVNSRFCVGFVLLNLCRSLFVICIEFSSIYAFWLPSLVHNKLS